MLDQPSKMKLVKGNSNAGIYDDGTSFHVVVKGDSIGTFGRDMSSAEKILNEKTGRSKRKVTG